MLSMILQRRALLFSFVRREIGSRYAGTLIGAVWALGQPVLLLLIYAFVFTRVLRVNLPDLGGHSFVTFLACGLWPWMAFSEGLTRATRAIVGNGPLVKKAVFPYELLVLSTVAATFIVHLGGFLAVLLVLWLLGAPFHVAGLLVMVGGWLLLFLLTYGLALATASIQVVVRDVEHVIGPILTLGFYISPILYPRNLVPENLRFIIDLNPIAQVLGAIRAALLHGELSPSWAALPLVVGVLLVVWVGQVVFRRLAENFEEFI
jgi:lipopolysaccharide transport system permease protein